MGFWGGLLKGLGAASGVIAAPFTGGASLATVLPAVLGAGGAVASGIAGAEASNRGAQTDAQQSRDALGIQNTNAYNNQVLQRGQLDLQRQQDTRAATDMAFRNSLRAALAKNMTDVSMARPSGVPTLRFSGGARPSALGVEGREAADLMGNRASKMLLDGPEYAELPDIERYALSDIPKQGTMEKILGPLGLGLTAAGAIAKLRANQPAPTATPEEAAALVHRVGGGTLQPPTIRFPLPVY